MYGGEKRLIFHHKPFCHCLIWYPCACMYYFDFKNKKVREQEVTQVDRQRVRRHWEIILEKWWRPYCRGPQMPRWSSTFNLEKLGVAQQSGHNDQMSTFRKWICQEDKLDRQWQKRALWVTKLVSIFHKKDNEGLYLDDAIGNKKRKNERYSQYHMLDT